MASMKESNIFSTSSDAGAMAAEAAVVAETNWEFKSNPDWVEVVTK